MFTPAAPTPRRMTTTLPADTTEEEAETFRPARRCTCQVISASTAVSKSVWFTIRLREKKSKPCGAVDAVAVALVCSLTRRAIRHLLVPPPVADGHVDSAVSPEGVHGGLASSDNASVLAAVLDRHPDRPSLVLR